MKPQTLPVKRNPVSKGVFKRLSAVTRGRKQRVAATATADDFEDDDHSSKISRALTIIFLIHIVVIGLIFFHQRFLDNGTTQEDETVATSKPAPVTPSAAEHRLPKMSTGHGIYPVVAGDNYPRIAAAQGVDESDLRVANDNRPIVAGMLMKIPPRRIVAMDPPEVTALRDKAAAPAQKDDGLVEAVPVNTSNAPKAQVVRPTTEHPTSAAVAPVKPGAPAASGKTYVVQPGDNLWRIANRFKVDQQALMKSNGITDPKKLKLGMTLTIPR